MRTLALLFSMTALALGCATTDEAPAKSAPPPPAEPPAPEKTAGADDGDDEEEDPLALPRTWAEVPSRYEFVCPAPLFTLEEPHVVEAAGRRFRIEGSTMVLEGEGPKERVVIGVLGALKDAAPNTRDNVRRAQAWFSEQGADFIVANGDLGEDDQVDAVFRMLGEETTVPVFAHSGNIEWSASFNDAWKTANAAHPHVFNMNWIRAVHVGDFALISLPGYFNTRFNRSGACRYSPDDVEKLRPLIATAQKAGKTVIVTAHGPPRSKGEGAIDVTFDGDNVGDEKLTALLEETGVRFGLFSHILEAGGRASADLGAREHLPMPQKTATERLYINAGSASSFPWSMHGGKSSEGIAALVTLEGERARVRFKKLR